jgi:hypothetical protein
MTKTNTDLEQRFARLETENARLARRLADLEAPPKSAAPKIKELEGATVRTLAPMPVAMPSAAEVERLYQVVASAHPVLKRPDFHGRWREQEAEEDSQGLFVCLSYLGTVPRTEALTTVNLSPSYLCSLCETHRTTLGLGSHAQVTRRLLMVAAIAWSDIKFSLDRYPHALALGLNYHGGSGRKPNPGAWARVLDGNLLPPSKMDPAPSWNCGAQQMRVVG